MQSERSSRSHRHTHSGAFSVLGSGSFTQGINMQRSMHTGEQSGWYLSSSGLG